MASLKVFTYTHEFTNVHFVQQGGRFLMIDSGLPDDMDNLLEFMQDNGLSPTAVDYLILTHGHPDHGGNAAAFQQRFGTKIIAGAAELPIINALGEDDLCPRGLTGRIIANTVGKQRYQAFSPDLLVTDSLDLTPLGWPGKLRVFTSHTPGSLVLSLPPYAFVGDLIKGQTLRKHHPAFHLIMCDHEANLQDLQRLAGDATTTAWLLGHFGPLDRQDILEFLTKKTTK